MSSDKHSIWCEKYRPQTLNDYIFHDENQRTAITTMLNDGSIPHLLLSGVQGSGKAQPLYSKILTPFGWTKMEDIKIGDCVITPSGRTSTVIGTFPQGKKDVYTVTFHDGSSTECCLDHLWECYYVDNYVNRTATKHVVDTRTIMQYLNTQKERKSESFNVSIPLTTAIEFKEHNNAMDDYLLGVLLGDGSFVGSGLRITSTDLEIIDECRTRLLDGYNIKLLGSTTKEYSLLNENRINFGGTRGVEENEYTKFLRSCGLHGKRSHEKFIPKMFKIGSINQRWELIRGLMDTDGTISQKRGSASYTTTSDRLAHDMQEMLWSLGCTCTISSRIPTYTYKGTKKEGRRAYTLNMNHNNGTQQFFKLSRKKKLGTTTFAQNHNKGDIQLRRRIVSIEYCNHEESQCIKIDDPDELYITDDYIVTHNTTLAFIIINVLGMEDTDVLTLNASDENSVDVMRDKIKGFVSTYAMGDFKIVHLEEADYITPNGQAVMRRLMEDYADTARFILTCNYENKIIPAVKSRCQHFRFTKHDIDAVTENVATILLAEGIKFDLDLLDKYVRVGYPDIRKIINLLQQNSRTGTLQSIADDSESGDYKFKLLELIETDDWLGARILACGEVANEEWEGVYRFIYENLDKTKKFSNKDKWEAGIITVADHLYKHSLVADPEINAAAMFIRLSQL